MNNVDSKANTILFDGKEKFKKIKIEEKKNVFITPPFLRMFWEGKDIPVAY